MSQPTSIDWCVDPRTGERGHSWNPVRGCSRVSEGCDHCFAKRIAARFSNSGVERDKNGEFMYRHHLGCEGSCDYGCNPKNGTVEPGLAPFEGFAVTGCGPPSWTGRVELIESKLEEPLDRGKPTLYFVNSMSDLFHEKLSDGDIDWVFATMALCPQHLFLILTKRAERMATYISDVIAACGTETRRPSVWSKSWPLTNVWLGVSVEDNAHRDRLDWLMKTPAALRFVSLEPMLSDVNIKPYLPQCPNPCAYCTDPHFGHPKPHVSGGLRWAITGAETGPGARPMNPDWARRVRDDCQAAGLPYFFKGWGGWAPADQLDSSLQYAHYKEHVFRNERTHESTLMLRVGRKAAGRLLDGHEWSQMPEVAA